MNKLIYLSCYLMLIAVKLQAQRQTDTIKCYVQIMVPASGTVGMSKETEDNQVFMNGGILLYTKAYAISDSPGHYVKFLSPKRKELKGIWKPKDPQVMEFEW
jgi:hypothetical protein